MADDNQSTSGKVKFIERHQPALEAGDYTIAVEQQITIPTDTNHPVKVDQTFKLQSDQKFSILGPRFTLDPQEIQAVFPPPGSLGEHSNVLPHIILKRSTLPWERSANGEKDTPWLALLLFDEGDIPNKTDDPDEIKAKNKALLDQIKTPNSWKLREMQTATAVDIPKSSDTTVAKTTYTVHFPKLGQESGDHPDDAVSVIDVPKSLLSQTLPSADELRLLAHVRQTADANNPQGDEVTVIICNRLPKSGSMSIVHLVSVEALYNSSGFVFRDADDGTLIRLVSLYSWRFACVSQRQSFKGLLMHLNHQVIFNIQATDAIENYLNGNSAMPEDLKQAFVQSNAVAPEEISSLRVIDQSTWKISAGKRFYYSSKTSGKIYDQAGRDTNRKFTSLDPNTQTFIKEANDLFGLKNSDAAKVMDDTGRWWMGIQQAEYFVTAKSMSPESAILYIYHLDPDSSSMLRLPDLASDDAGVQEMANSYFAMGCVPLPHEMRQGNMAVSWYHGPLIPGTKTNDVNLPIRSSDELVRYSPTTGMFDVSYSAAWEMGRLLTLQNKRASLDLFNWKRSHAQSFKDTEKQLDHLPFDIPVALDLPESVRTWFRDLALLKGLPFNYLVPDERMLPTESIRFFQVDSSWVECLLDGVFSIGRVLSTDHEREGNLNVHPKSEKQLSGFLLRSDVVAGWPGLLVDGYRIIDNVRMKAMIDELNKLDNQNVSVALQKVFGQEGLTVPLGSTVVVIEKDTHWSINDSNLNPVYKVTREEDQLLIKLPGLRIDRLSKNVLLCLFEGIIQAIDIHLKPETLHFGVSERDDEHPVNWYKTQRDKDGIEQPSQWIEVSLKDKSVIDIATLAQKITDNHTSAELALQMLEGVEKVRFVQKAGLAKLNLE